MQEYNAFDVKLEQELSPHPTIGFLLHKHFPSIAIQLLKTTETSTTWNSNELHYNVTKKTQCWIEPALPVFHILWSIVIDSNPNRYS